jgi:hypothetical protein
MDCRVKEKTKDELINLHLETHRYKKKFREGFTLKVIIEREVALALLITAFVKRLGVSWLILGGILEQVKGSK